MGADFEKLHPQVQRRFGFSSLDGVAAIGRGVMEITRGPLFTAPFLMIGAWRNILVREQGTDVPFTVENYAYLDRFGRETVTWVRTFEFGARRRRFDATMIFSEQRGCIVDYLGTHQHLAVDIHPSVARNGGLQLRSGEQRFYEGPLGFRFPLLFSGVAEVCEWYDDAEQCFRVSVVVKNRTWGFLIGYRGSFTVEWRPCAPGDVPPHVKPVREEARE
jgi:hypothetical protein